MGLRGPKPRFVDQACPNQDCAFHGKTGEGNIVANGTYPTTSGRVRKFICRACGTVFCSREGTAFYDLRSDQDLVLLAVKLLLKGMSLRGVAETLGVKLDTVRGWLRRAAEHAESVNDVLVRHLKVSQVELDELWSFVKKKRLRAWQERRRATVGSGRPSRRSTGSSFPRSLARAMKALRES